MAAVNQGAHAAMVAMGAVRGWEVQIILGVGGKNIFGEASSANRGWRMCPQGREVAQEVTSFLLQPFQSHYVVF